MKLVKDFISSLFKRNVKNSLLRDFLDKECSDLQKSVLSKNMKIWMDSNSRAQTDSHKNYFELSMGTLFEYFMAVHIVSKQWEFVIWRGDKIAAKRGAKPDVKPVVKPQSNSFPDLIFEYCGDENTSNGFMKGDRIAIECKWTRHIENCSLEQCAKNKLKKYVNSHYPKNALMDNACCFFFAIGVGWNSQNGRPEAIYIIPAKRIKSITDDDSLENIRLKRKARLRKSESLISTILIKDEIESILKQQEDSILRLKESLNID